MYQSVYLADRPINVGWGKKETQFHGSEGKPTAANIQEVVSCSYLVTIVLMNANTYNTSWLFYNYYKTKIWCGSRKNVDNFS